MKMTAPQSLKFSKLKRRLALPHWQAVGLLESIWLFTQVNAPAGDIGRHTDEDIAAGIEWHGDPTQLIDALIDCGWLDRSEAHRVIVHDWQDHVPKYLKGAMAKNGKPFASGKAKQPAKPRKQTANPVKQPAQPAEQPAPSLVLPCLANSNLVNPTDSSEPPSATSEPTVVAVPPVLVFPVVGKETQSWPLTAAQVAEWRAIYPGIDVLAECRKALAWSHANPTRRKTLKGMPAFLVNWLNRAQNAAGRGTGPPAVQTRQAADDAYYAKQVASAFEGQAIPRAS